MSFGWGSRRTGWKKSALLSGDVVWVDDHDLAVVKSDGKAVPDLKEQLYFHAS